MSNQPPMIPHSVDGYQISKNTNRCLQCHGVEHYRTTGAPRISPTHFMDSDGKVLGGKLLHAVISVCNATYHKPMRHQSSAMISSLCRALGTKRGSYGRT
ncbi:Diheme cytochrome c NapB precursor [Serratia fonticola]|uniref:Periplasmic nitrate reductase, electron transfer subunit n=1 Tax=Serratia fonticola TaxID=47917 RepID=A0A4U9V730_SERFO|nr:Diheme cytochrome c NapB precursor [Serratia fonticola]